MQNKSTTTSNTAEQGFFNGNAANLDKFAIKAWRITLKMDKLAMQ